MFAWENFSKSLLKDFARAAGLRVSFAAEDLAANFGTPPGEGFIDVTWEVLRDRWIGGNPSVRDTVVTALRNKKLGDTSKSVSSKAGQISYLKSCRMSASLKSIVLSEFLDAGAVAAEMPAEVSTPATKDSEIYLLEKILMGLTDDQILRLEDILHSGILDALNRYPAPSTTPEAAAAYFANNLMMAIIGSSASDIEIPDESPSPARVAIRRGAARIATSGQTENLFNSFLLYGLHLYTDKSNLEPADAVVNAIRAVLSMLASGDLDPATVDPEIINDEIAAFIRRAVDRMEQSEQKAQSSVDATSGRSIQPNASVVGHPDKPASANDEEATENDDADQKGFLGRVLSRFRSSDQDVATEPTTPKSPQVTTVAPDPQRSMNKDELKVHLTGLFEQLGIRVFIDEDGDFVFARGSAVLYLTIVDKGASFLFIRASSTLVRGVTVTSDLLETLMKAQDSLPIGRFVAVEDRIGLLIDVPADSITIHELEFVVMSAFNGADHFDTIFAKMFGGETSSKDTGDVIEA